MADTITQRYADVEQWEALLERIGLNLRHRTRLVSDGFTSLNVLVQHYKIAGPKAFETYLKDLNKTFATANTNAIRVYYNPMIIKRLCGILYYFRTIVLGMHMICDINMVT